MLLFDLSGIVVHTCINLHHESHEDVTTDVVRHVAFSSLLYYKKKFSRTHGVPIVCVDCKPYWRESVFPYYKKNRKKSRDSSNIDWDAFSENFKCVQEDIAEYSPYPIIDVPRAEADDAISVLTQYGYARKKKVMIVSSDKDMIQLQDKYSGVKQFSPNRRKFLTPADSEYTLLTHTIKGDTSDGIPNIFSPDDVLMSTGGPRQKSVTQQMLADAESALKSGDVYQWDMLDEDSRKKLKRNQLLIDTSLIPTRIKDRIIERYEEQTQSRKPNRMLEYVRKHRLRHLLPSVKDF